MKHILIILLFALPFTATAQKFNGARIQPGTVKQEALAPDAIRPTANGVLTDPALVFGPAPQKKYTVTVTSDVALSLAAGTQTAESRIYIRATGDGSHTLSFPPTWIVEGTYNPNAINLIDLKYDGIDVIVKILSSVPVIIPVLTDAVVLESNPDEIAFTYSTAVTTTIVGWSLSGSGGAITATGVNSGSGTNAPKFALSRNVAAGEVLTVSYNPAIGGTVSATNNELAVVTNFSVETWDVVVPPTEFCDITVCPTGGDYSTWQAASDAAVAGQTVCGCAGTYRETVVAKTGVKYRNIPGDVVVITGLNEAGNTGWTVHSGQIYKKTISLPITGFASTITSNTTLLANQIFKDGVMQFQARWPKVSSLNDLLDRDKNRHFRQMSSGVIGQSSLTDTGLPTANLTGASIWVQGWFIAQTRTITADNGSTISYSGLNSNPKFQRWYYVINDLELLTDEKEWHYESNTLYFRQTGGGSPTGVEYKARNWGFDLRGKDNVTIEGITFKGCEPATGDTQTDGCVIDNIRASYMNHAFMQVDPDQIYNSAKQTGMKLLGNNNTVKNSEFQYASSQVIWAGPGTIVQNNLVSDVAYDGNYGAFVTPYPGAGNIKILNNTGSRFGRSAVDGGYDEGGNHHNLEIAYNNFHTYLMLNADGGLLYFARGVRLNGTRIHHNWLHDNDVGDDWAGSTGAGDYDGIHVNLYFDQGTGPTTVDHNVMWLGGVADYYSQVISTTQNIYNNTFAHTGDRESYIVAQTTPNDVVRNNIFVNTVNINWSSQRGDVAYSIVPTYQSNFNSNGNILTNSPLFVGPANTGAGYYLQSGSPARNAGVVIPGITDDDDGTPDLGAYKYGAEWATPGYNQTAGEYIIDNAEFNYTGTGWQHFTGQAWTPPPTNSVSFSPTLGAYMEGTFTGTEVKLYAEKRFNQGIVEVEIDGVRVDCDPGTGGTQDCDLYDPQSVNNSTLIGTWTVSAGDHDIKIELVGENAAADNSPSPHANIIFDYLEITP